MHISSALLTYVCFAPWAVHMEGLFMENKSDVICPAIPGYELPLPLLGLHSYQCSLRKGDHSECFRARMLWFSLEKSLGGYNLIATKRNGCVGARNSFFLGIPKELVGSVSHISEQRSRKQSKCIPFPFMWKKTVLLSFQELPSPGICLDLLFGLHSSGALLNRLALKQVYCFSGGLSCFKGGFQDGRDERKSGNRAPLLEEICLFVFFFS